MLSPEQFEPIREAIAKYKEIRNEITTLVPFYPLGLNHYEHDYSCVGFNGKDKRYICLNSLCDENNITLPINHNETAKIIFPNNSKTTITIQDNSIYVSFKDKSGVVIEIC